MARVGHGDVQTAGQTGQLSTMMFTAAGKAADFGYMFGSSPDTPPSDNERLPETDQTIAQLVRLAEAMGSAESGEPDPMSDRVVEGDGTIPAAYTYFGQFVDHDITATGGVPDITGGTFEPLRTLAEVSNGRTAHLEHDSVYSRPGSPDNQVPPPQGARMEVGEISIVGGAAVGTDLFQFVEGKGPSNDLPRKPRNADPKTDREARIGDPRNDENLIVAQLHVAFLKAHNTLAGQLKSFEAARKALTLIYQSVIVDDFLRRICDGETLDRILAEGPRFFDPEGPAFMPVEFAAGAYRLGHSMVRTGYDFNLNFSPADSRFIFTFTALSGNIAPAGVPVDQEGNPIGSPEAVGSDTFPHNWIIDWPRFLSIDGSKPQRARPIDPLLTPLLATLRDSFGNPIASAPPLNVAQHLAKRNLLRGYQLSLPTGQAVAEKLGVAPIAISADTTGLPADVLVPFAERTPLWLYVLTEAKLNGGKLGVVGSTIVAETLIGQIKRSRPSIFDEDGGRISDDRHSLADIIELAGEQDAGEELA